MMGSAHARQHPHLDLQDRVPAALSHRARRPPVADWAKEVAQPHPPALSTLKLVDKPSNGWWLCAEDVEAPYVPRTAGSRWNSLRLETTTYLRYPSAVAFDLEAVEQQQTNWCWAAVVHMAQYLLGMSADEQCAIVSRAFGADCCESPALYNHRYPMADFGDLLRKNGLTSRTSEEPITHRTLSDEVYSRRPVIVGWIWSGSTNGHYVLVLDDPVHERRPPTLLFRVADPVHGKRKFSYDELLNPLGGSWRWTWHSIQERESQ